LVSNSCVIYEDIKRFLTGNVQKLKFFHTLYVKENYFLSKISGFFSVC
jgi:hypothetical protein